MFFAVTSLVGCQNEVYDNLQENTSFVISASLDNNAESRTMLNTDGNLVWSSDDELSIFLGTTTNQKFKIFKGGGTNYAEFVSDGKIYITGGTESDENAFVNVGYYPYNENISVVKDGANYVLSSSLPQIQKYCEGSFGLNAFPMAAVTSNKLDYAFAFKNVCGYLEMRLKGNATIIQAEVKSLANKLSGPCDITVANGAYPSIKMDQNASSTVILDCSEGVALSSDVETSFIFVVPPTTFESGDLSFTFYDNNGHSHTWTVNAEIIVPRNDFVYWTTNYTGPDTAIPTLITNETLLKSALQSGASNESPVVISGDIELSEPLNVSVTTTIDLNGYSLNTGDNTINVAEGATLTLNNGSSNTYSRSTIVNASITGSSDIITAAKNSTITIGEGVNLTTTGANMCCVFVPAGAENVTINTQGNLLATQAGGATIYVNGTVESGTINVMGGSVKQEQDVAIYIAGKADLNISGGEIEGTTGVEIRAGKLNVTGGTITATAEEFVATPNGNGSTSIGAAIAVTQHSTNHELTATISGGTFTGVRALYEEDTCDDNISGISMSVNGGIFNGEVYSENVTSFITRGTFHKSIPANYTANNSMVAVSGSNDAKIYEVIDLSNGYTMTSDIEIATPITINTAGSINFNLGTYSLTNRTAYDYDACGKTECYVFEVQSGTLNISGSGSVNAIGGSDYDMAVFANGSGKVNISGGKFTNEGKENAGCDLIYVRDQAEVAITGGEFEAGNLSADVGYQYVALNLRDANRSTASITVTGGKFYKFNPANNVSEGALTNFTANNTMVAVSGSNDAKIYEVIDLSNGYTMTSDIEIATPITINTAGSINFNLGTYSLTNRTAYDYDACGKTECYVFEVQSGTLNISGSGSVNAIGGSDYDMAVFANGSGKVNISGGKFTNEGKENAGCDLIYVRGQAAVAIAGGEFEAGNLSADVGNQYVALNLRDADRSTASISVTGGKFYKFNPANNVSEGANTNFVAEGYSSYIDGDYYKVSATSEGTTVTEALSVVNW